MKALWKRCLAGAVRIATRVWEWLRPVVPGVAVTVMCLDLIPVFIGAAFIAGAVATGIISAVSILLVICNLPDRVRKRVIGVIARHGYVVDAVSTAILTVAGFRLSVTLGIVAMIVGLHVSGLVSVFRWVDYWNRRFEPPEYVHA